MAWHALAFILAAAQLRASASTFSLPDAKELGSLFDGAETAAGPAPVSAAPDQAKGDELDGFLQAHGVPPADRPQARKTVEELWKVLSGVGVALGAEKSLEFRIGDWWSTDLESGQINIPMQEILKNLNDTPVLVGGIAHEAGHVYWTRYTKLKDYQKLIKSAATPEAIHSFHNVLEDMWMEQAVGLRWPGAPFYIKSLHRKTRPDLAGTGSVAISGGLLPHEEFLEVLRQYWIMGRFPDQAAVPHPAVREAMIKTRDGVARFMTLVPGERSPSEGQRVALSSQRFELVQRDIYPHYLALLEISKEQLKKQRKSGGKKGKGKQSESESEQEINKEIEARAEENAKKNSPTHGQKEGKGQKSVAMNPAHRGDGASAQTNWGPQKTLEVVSELLKRQHSVLASSRPRNRYEAGLAGISSLVEPLVGRLSNLFIENTAPKWEGHYNSGQSVDVKKWMRSEARGWRQTDDYQVFLRRTVPTKRDYKFRLLLDLSGSMNGERKELAIDTAVLFLETLERLEIDCSVMGFDTQVYSFKDFSEDPRNPKKATFEEKRILVDEVGRQGGGGTHDAEAVLTALKGDAGRNISALEEQPGDLRYLIVVTDGEGNGPASGRMDDILRQAAEQQVAVIGIGIGEGMDYVSRRYARSVIVPNLETLPLKVADILERSIREGFLPPKAVE